MQRLLLIACGATKAPYPTRARDLYTGRLFRSRLAYAEESGHPWAILSAKHGLVDPDQVLHPYDQTMPTDAMASFQWGLTVFMALCERGWTEHGCPLVFHRSPVDDRIKVHATLDQLLQDVVLEVHAGRAYVQAIRRVVEAVELNRGPHPNVRAFGSQVPRPGRFFVECPTAGLGIGRQLQFYQTFALCHSPS